MTNTGPDMECTFFPNGFPEWMGGTGTEWMGCCQAHDQVPNTISNAFALGDCVARTGYPLIGAIMVLGLILFGWIYNALRARRG